MRVACLTNTRAMDAVAAAWNELAANHPFRRYEWLGGWWRHYGATYQGAPAVGEPLVLAVYEAEADRQPVAVAPWYIEHSWTSGRTIRFFGDGEVCSEYPTILCQPGSEDAVAATVANWLCHDASNTWDTIHFRACHPADTVMHGLADRLADEGHHAHWTSGESCWKLQLPATWDEYLGLLSKSHRKQVRRLVRCHLETGRVCFRTSHAGQLSEDVETLSELHRRRRTSRRENGCFNSPRFCRFLRDVAPCLAAADLLQLNLLEIDGRAVAADYNLVGGRTIYAYQSGIDPEALDIEPGRLLTLETIRRAIGDWIVAYDLLRGDEPYKAHLRAQPHSTLDLRVARAAAGPRARHMVWRTGRQAKQWAKQGLAATRQWQTAAATVVARLAAIVQRQPRAKTSR